jgi:hypothetical protein
VVVMVVVVAAGVVVVVVAATRVVMVVIVCIFLQVTRSLKTSYSFPANNIKYFASPNKPANHRL